MWQTPQAKMRGNLGERLLQVIQVGAGTHVMINARLGDGIKVDGELRVVRKKKLSSHVDHVRGIPVWRRRKSYSNRVGQIGHSSRGHRPQHS